MHGLPCSWQARYLSSVRNDVSRPSADAQRQNVKPAVNEIIVGTDQSWGSLKLGGGACGTLAPTSSPMSDLLSLQSCRLHSLFMMFTCFLVLLNFAVVAATVSGAGPALQIKLARARQDATPPG